MDTGTQVHGRFDVSSYCSSGHEKTGAGEISSSLGSSPEERGLELDLEDGRNLEGMDGDRGEHSRGCAGLNKGPETRVFSVFTEWEWSGGSRVWKGRPGPNGRGHPEPGGKSRWREGVLQNLESQSQALLCEGRTTEEPQGDSVLAPGTLQGEQRLQWS